MKRIISLLSAVLLIAALTLSASAADYGCDVDTVTDAVYMENLDTGNVVFEKASTERVYPASTTKVMTFIVAAEQVTNLDDMVEIKESVLSDLDPESSVMGLEAHIGESVSVRDLLYGLMLPSGNDAALVLSDYVAGSVTTFVEMMNAKAAELSCINTHFVSPHGLFDERHYSTAQDMAVITKYAMSLPSFMDISSALTHTVTYSDSEEEEIETTNYLVDSSQKGGYYYYPYAKGIKTGYTDEAGRCLISTAEKDGYRYLLVALGAEYSFEEDINYAMLDSKELYEWAFSHISLQTVTDSSSVLSTIPVKYASGQTELNLIPKDGVSALLPNGYASERVSTQIDAKSQAEAPVKAGDVYGTIEVFFDGELIGTADLVAQNDVERNTLSFIFGKLLEFVEGHVVLTIVILLVLFLLIIILILSVRAKKRRKRRQQRRRYR